MTRCHISAGLFPGHPGPSLPVKAHSPLFLSLSLSFSSYSAEASPEQLQAGRERERERDRETEKEGERQGEREGEGALENIWDVSHSSPAPWTRPTARPSSAHTCCRSLCHSPFLLHLIPSLRPFLSLLPVPCCHRHPSLSHVTLLLFSLSFSA